MWISKMEIAIVIRIDSIKQIDCWTKIKNRFDWMIQLWKCGLPDICSIVKEIFLEIFCSANCIFNMTHHHLQTASSIWHIITCKAVFFRPTNLLVSWYVSRDLQICFLYFFSFYLHFFLYILQFILS